jgi:serine/threonine protein kinase
MELDPEFVKHLAKGGFSPADYALLSGSDRAGLFQAFTNSQTVAPPPPAVNTATRVTLESLFRNWRISFDPAILTRMRERYTTRVKVILEEQNEEFARNSYCLAEILPGTSTRIFAEDVYGYVINGVYELRDELVICYKGRAVFLLKLMSDSESKRIYEFMRACEKDVKSTKCVTVHPNIVPFHVMNRSTIKTFLIMPKLASTVEPMTLDLPEAVVLWENMRDALRYLHENNFAHCDVKPSNICSDNTKYVLIDLGSVCRFGSMSASTPAFLPKELQKNQLSSSAVDWWMLALTLLDKGLHLRIGEGAKEWRKCNIIEELEKHGESFMELIDILKSQ